MYISPKLCHARNGFVAKNMLELPGVWSDATSPPNPCWIVVCSSSAPRSDINSLIISGPVPLVRPTLHLCQIAEALRE